MKISQILNDSKTLAIDIENETLNVTYKPSSLTPEIEENFLANVENKRSGFALAQFLSSVIFSWDLVTEDGSEYKPTLDNLKSLPINFLNEVIGAIFEDLSPKKTKSQKSKGSF
jgi:hypothetical protein